MSIQIKNFSLADSDEVDGAKKLKVVLAGNPNVGKSVFFNAFTGVYVEVSNYPGTTVDLSRAVVDGVEVLDTPGVYGLGSYNDEEIVAQNIIITADKIVNVVNALNIERDLFLTQQLIDMGIPFVIALNQLDEAKARGLNLNIDILEELLDVKVFPTVAIKDKGIQEVKDYVFNNEISLSSKITPLINEFIAKQSFQALDRPKEVLNYEENVEIREQLYSQRRDFINKIVDATISETSQGVSLSTLVGKSLLNPFVGSISAMLTLLVLYKFIGVYVAGDTVDFVEHNIIQKYYTPWVVSLVSAFIKSGILKAYLVGEFGILTMCVQYILGVLLPLIAAFHLFMALLEDSGYLPRLAVLTDRFLSKIGLNGRAIIPIILGFGCTTMATLTTRILGSNRERTIATTILGLSIPCSAQLGIIIGLLAAIGGVKVWLVYVLSILSIFVLTGTILNRLLPGESSHLLIDLPPMRVPLLKNVFKKTYSKTIHFLKESAPLFVIGSVAVTTLIVSGGINVLQNALEPITVNLLKLPPEMALVFIMGLLRRDFAASGLMKLAGADGGAAILSPQQILTSLIVLTLFVPCIISVTVLFKERGYKEAILIWISSLFVAFATGAIICRLIPFIF